MARQADESGSLRTLLPAVVPHVTTPASVAGLHPAPLETTPLEYLRDPRRAITETGIVCLVCGRAFRHLTNTHLRAHGLTSGEYKQRFGYNVRRALMILPVRRAHADNARKSGLAGRIRRNPIFEGIELRRLGGRRPHTLEEGLTRRETRRRSPFTALRDSRGRFTTAPMSSDGFRPDALR